MILKQVFFLGMLTVLTILAGCRDHSRDVVAIPKTHSYHTEKCPRVKMANTETMPIDEARTLRLKACPGCKPDLKIK